MTEPQPVTEDPAKSRAAFIRALVAAGVTKPKTIIAYCVDAGFPAPTNQAVISARQYLPKGGNIPARPTYRFLCEQFTEAYRNTIAAGVPIVITRELKELIIVMEHCCTTDTSIEKRKLYKRKQKRKRAKERKAKAQPKPITQDPVQ